MGLIAISSMYLERNRRKVVVAAKNLKLMEIPTHATIKEATTPQNVVPVNDFDKPDSKEFDYMPTKISDIFESVAPSINQKAVLTSIYPLHGVTPNKLYEELGFGHINGL